MIKEYNSFIQEMLFESMINESIVYYSPRFKKILSKVSDKGNEVAKELLDYQGQNSKQDVTFIDIDNQEGYLSFITMRNAIKLIEPVYPHVVTGNSPLQDVYNDDMGDALWKVDQSGSGGTGIYKRSRNQIKVGKIVNKLLPGKFNDKQIEEFVNLFKATIENTMEKFVVVEGDDIAKWYNQENYKERKGTLGSSCMRSMSSTIFNIYTKNPEVCRLLILMEEDKILGRALVWKLNTVRGASLGTASAPEYFLDRQYTINYSDVNKFRDYAEKQGWGYKTNNNSYSFKDVTFNNTDYKLNMTVQLKENSKGSYDYNKYPYLDTFRRYDPYNGILYNDNDRDGNEGHYILESTSGGYEEIESGVWSEWHGEDIPEDEAVWSDNMDTYLRRSDAVEVSIGSRRNRGWWPIQHDNIVLDEWLDEYIHIDDAVYSDHLDRYIYQDSAISAVKYIRSNGSINAYTYYIHQSDTDGGDAVDISDIDHMTWYKKMSDRYKHFGDPNWDSHNAIMKECLIKDSEGNWIPKNFSIKIYRGVNDEEEYYLPIDAQALDIKLDMGDKSVIDRFRYEESMRERLHLVKKNLLNMANDLRAKIDGIQTRLKFEDDEDYITNLKRKLNVIFQRLDEIEGEYYL